MKTNLKWWQKTLVYEVYTSSFKDSNNDGLGDIRGIISKLDYLADLGVGAIWLTPVYASPMGDNGYDVSDYYSINPIYGTMADMDELISEAGKRNIKIVMDLVFNHTSKECEWFKKSCESKDNEYSDFYIWKDPKEDGSAPNNWRGIFGGSVWTYCETRKQYYMHTFADFQPDVNWENENLRKALYDIANFWSDKGVGGFRIDAITYIKKPEAYLDGKVDGLDNMSSVHPNIANTLGILDFLKEFKENVGKGKDIFTVGEANGVKPSELKDWVGENGVFDMIFEFSHVNIQFASSGKWFDTRDWNLSELKKCLNDSQRVIKDDGWYPIFLENHDKPRSCEHFLKGKIDYKLGAKALATYMLTFKGTPFLYQGQELGMSNTKWEDINDYNDIFSHNQYNFAIKSGLTHKEAMDCIHNYSRDNARVPMQWSSGLNAGFSDKKPWLKVNDNYATINVENELEDEDSILNYYYNLNELRQEYSCLIDGDYKSILDDDESVFAYIRENKEDKLIILINFTDKEVSYDIDLNKDSEVLLSNYSNTRLKWLRPYESLIIKY